MAHGNQMSVSNTAVVGVRPAPRLVAGHLDQQDLESVSRCASHNTDALVAYWDGKIDTVQLGQVLKRLA